jgi:hypothetical protein
MAELAAEVDAQVLRILDDPQDVHDWSALCWRWLPLRPNADLRHRFEAFVEEFSEAVEDARGGVL